MPDDPNTPDPNAGQAGGTPPAGTPPQGGQSPQGTPPGGTPPAQRTFTQEEVNQLTGRAREEGRQAALKKAGGEGNPPKPDGQNGSGVTAPQVPNVEELIQRSVQQALQAAGVDPFTQTARAAGYSDAQIKLARAAHDVEKPADLGKWLTEWPASIGMQINRGGANGAAPQGGPQVGAPRTVKRLEQESGLVDVFSLSDEEVAAMPIEQLVAHFEKAKDAARQSQGAPLLPRALRKK